MKRKSLWLIAPILVLGLCLVLYFSQDNDKAPTNFPVLQENELGNDHNATAMGTELSTFGSGCFWCTEAIFQELRGVKKVVSGYSGGSVKNPSYKEVCTGKTGHAEVVQVTFDPMEISYPELLQVFWRSHDPTTLNRQGNDVGTQYRSVIFYHSEPQKQLATRYKQKIEESGEFQSPLVTEIVPFNEFFPAESNHQNYFAENSNQPYCRLLIRPKLEKLREVFPNKLKAE